MEVATYNTNNVLIETINPLIINISAAIIILLAGLMVGKLLSMIVKKIFLEVEADKTINKISPIKISITNIISLGVSIPIYIISFFLAMKQIGIATIVINLLLAILVLGIIGALILGIKDIPVNFIAGLKFKQKNIIGKKVRVGYVFGTVTKKGILKVEMETKQKDRIIVPNKYFEKNYRKLA
jgi:small-conductance mechanosensitive channel